MPAGASSAEGLSYQQSLILSKGPINSGLRALVTVFRETIIPARDPSYPQRTFVTVEGFIKLKMGP